MAAERAHGTLAKYTEEKCPCDDCRGAMAAWSRNKSRMVAYGRWQPYVDAERARAHVKMLTDYGIGWQRIADLAGVPRGSVSRLLYGDSTNGRTPSRRIRPSTEQRLLSVKPVHENLSSTTAVDALGTRRRLQALVAIGWSQKILADRVGLREQTIGDITKGKPTVSRATADTVRNVYAELWKRTPPQATRRERSAFERARRFAASKGWVSPLAWDDIDDPDAVPDLGEESRPSAGENVRWLLEQGLATDEVARQLGFTEEHVKDVRRRMRRAKA